MDHGDHGGHGDMPIPHECSMNMHWNTQIIDTCIVFRSWHISSTTQFVLSCFAIAALGVLFEYLRSFSKALDYNLTTMLAQKAGKKRRRSIDLDSGSEEAGLISGRIKPPPGLTVPLSPRALRAVTYGATVFLSFFLMLVFMTYNAYLIFATVAGAAIGHFIFGGTIHFDEDGKGMACH